MFKETIVAGAEDGGAYTDEGTAFFDGYGVIVAHAHGEHTESGIVLEEACLEAVEDATGLVEVSPDTSRIGGVAGHGHQAGDSDMLKIVYSL